MPAHTALRHGVGWPNDLRIYRRVYTRFPRQIDFARELGWTRGLVSLYETGARLPKLSEARRMLDLLGERMGRRVLISEIWDEKAVRQMEDEALKAAAEGEAR